MTNQTHNLGHVDKIKQSKSNAFTQVFEYQQTRSGSLADLPIAIKENMDLAGTPTSAGCALLYDNVANQTATVVQQLLEQGAVIVGKTNMDEFAMGSSGKNVHFGKTNNPAFPYLYSGGSSGGSAAAVAEGLCFAALGTDTGGSVRQPAAMCGVCGFKPTYNALSCQGVFPCAASLDTVGILAQNIADITKVFDALTNSKTKLAGDLKGKKIGVLVNSFEFEFDQAVKDFFDQVKVDLGNNGAQLVDINYDKMQMLMPIYYVLSYGQGGQSFCQNVAPDYENKYKNIGSEVKRRIIFSEYLSSNPKIVEQTERLRQIIEKQFLRLIKNCDAVITPTMPKTDLRVGSELYKHNDALLILANLFGLPSVCVPKRNNQMPLSIQVMANKNCDDAALSVADSIYKILNSGSSL